MSRRAEARADSPIGLWDLWFRKSAERERPWGEESRAPNARPLLLRMAGGEPAVDPVARDNLVVILSIKAVRFRLGKKVKSALATYLSATLELETLEEIES